MEVPGMHYSKLVLDQDTQSGGLIIKTEGYTSRDDYDLLSIWNANDVPSSNYAGFIRQRGTLDNPQPMHDGDEIFSLFWAGQDTSNQPRFAAELTVGSEGTITTGHVPAYFDFKVMGDKGLIESVLKVHNNGTIGISKRAILDKSKVSLTPEKFLRVEVDGKDYAIPLHAVISNS